MSASLAAIYRHPLKAIGREALDRVELIVGEPLPWDRAFAIAHENARPSDLAEPWAHKVNFLRGVSGPELMAVTCAFDEQTKTLTLHHPRQDSFTGSLDQPECQTELLGWLDTLWPEAFPRPASLHATGTAQTDVPNPWVAINSVTANRMVAQKLGDPDLSIHRWRGNLWVEGLGPWEEFEWLGRDLRIGDATLRVRERITRCKATMANPGTGKRDLDTLAALEDGWGHTDFGVYAEVINGAMIQPGDFVEVV